MVEMALDSLRAAWPEMPVAGVGIVCGTGLGDLVRGIRVMASLDYADIQGFPRSTVEGHAGQLLAGILQGVPVFALQGRHHLYEGYEPHQVVMGVRLLAGLGVKKLIITNAAGSLNPLYPAGSLLCVSDHINLTGRNPLTGPNVEAWGVRFPDMSQVYDAAWRERAHELAMSLGIRLENGVYAGICGPSLETPAETRMLRLLGADAVGMSTVLEVIAARHLGMDVLALSCLTNLNLPDAMRPTCLEDVLATAQGTSSQLCDLVDALVRQFATTLDRGAIREHQAL